MIMKPTLGRIVHYMEDGEIYPAMVVFVQPPNTQDLSHHFDMINIVFWDGLGESHAKSLVPYSKDIAKDDRHWFWPPMPIPTADDMKKIKERIIAQQKDLKS